jgi:LysR family transcriptional regulator, glycine cleavage system transcriptional activator
MASNMNPNPGVKLPPLNALRAFEAAARLASFARAAAELHVTPAAVSHQVKGLEDVLGVKLFRRRASGLELTHAGRVCQPKLREGFQRLAEAVEQIRATGAPGTLSIDAAPTFAAKWLAPRLHRFVATHRQLDVRINARTRLIDVPRDGGRVDEGQPVSEDADLSIRFGGGDYPEMRVDKLLAVSVTPMCGARRPQGERLLREPRDLREHVLIHDNVPSDDGRPLWLVWLEAAGVEGVDVLHGLRFNHASLALDAAADGLGIALGMPQIAAFDLAAGRLVAPFPLRVPLASAYYLVSPRERSDRSEVTAFRRWIQHEAQREDPPSR